MDSLPTEILRHIFSYTNCTTQVSLKLSCRLYNTVIGDIHYTNNCIFAELCCLDNNFSMFVMAIECWKHPLLQRYYKSAVIGKSLEILKYLHNHGVTVPNDTVYLAAVHGNEDVYRYARQTFLHCDFTCVGTVPRPYIPMHKIEMTDKHLGIRGVLVVKKALENNNLPYLKLLHSNGMRFNPNFIWIFMMKYRHDRSLKEIAYWLIDNYGYNQNSYMTDDPKLFIDKEFDLIRCLYNGYVNLISWRYNIHVTDEMSLTEIIALLPEDACKDCKSPRETICYLDLPILLFCEKHGIIVKDLDFNGSYYRKSGITVEGLECINRLFPYIFDTLQIRITEKGFLREDFKLVKDWLTKKFPGKYTEKFFFDVIIEFGLVEEIYKHEDYSFERIVKNSNTVKIWDFAYENYPSETLKGYTAKQIVWLKARGLLNVEGTIKLVLGYSLEDKQRIVDYISS